MLVLLIIVAVIAAIYIYAAIAQYYGFKNWYPMCGCKGTSCSPGKQPEAGSPDAPSDR